MTIGSWKHNYLIIQNWKSQTKSALLNCSAVLVAGKMKGMSKAEWEQGNSTRSGLFWEVERIIKELPADELPQVLLMENVPQVHAELNTLKLLLNSVLDL
ncbi:MAG: DNA cytosine methyltransferase [Treponema sp.]|nr:DNA cytosine methyltransferase [Treponema sp.]